PLVIAARPPHLRRLRRLRHPTSSARSRATRRPHPRRPHRHEPVLPHREAAVAATPVAAIVTAEAKLTPPRPAHLIATTRQFPRRSGGIGRRAGLRIPCRKA